MHSTTITATRFQAWSRRSAALIGLVMGLLLQAPVAKAADLDIYTERVQLPLQAPLTVLALDLNLTNPNSTICDNILLSSDPNCIEIRGRVTLGDLITLLGVPSSVIAGLDPNALLSDLSTGVLTILATPLSVSGTLSLTQQQLQVLGVQQILNALVDSRVSILLNHANKGPAAGVCAFADLASLPAARQDTLACSNGAYLFAGLTNLSDPLQLAALLTKVATALLPSVVNLPGQPGLFSANHPYQSKEIYAELTKYLRGDAIFNGHLGNFDYGDNNATTNLNASFPLLSWDANAETSNHRSYKSGLADYPQACTINLVHVQLTNAAAQNDSDAALKTLFPESDANGDGQLTLPELVSAADQHGFTYGASDRRRIRSSFVVQENLFTQGDLSELDQIANLGTNVTSYTNLIGLLGRGQSIAGSLIEPLSINTTLNSLSVAASRSSSTGILTAAYLPAFRADEHQKPAWPGNLKRLKLRYRAAPNQNIYDVVDARDDANQAVNPAIGSNGRIRNNALSFWTNPAKLGAGVSSDGPVADLGGAGQNIPGFQFGGGGNPGRGNNNNIRTLYYDSLRGLNNTLCQDLASCAALNPDDAGVRTELLAATGATAVTLPDPNCATNCQAAADARDAACNAPGAFTSVCNAENSACLSSCGSGNYTNVCNAELATCNSGCAAGVAGTLCRTNCNTTWLACPAAKIAQCNLTCPAALALCPATKQAACLADSAAQNTACRLTCQITRSADTVARELLLYARGFDVGTRGSPKGTGPATSPTNTGVTGRPWLMGAVLHSRPLAINYGKRNGSGNPEVIRVLFGSADGVMHMVDDATGVEKWGFMPQAVMGSLATLRENAAGSAVPYGADGSPIVLIRDRSGSSLNSAGDGVISAASSPHDRVLVIFGLRRGGGAYYALDVTEPDSPKLVWKLSTAGLHRAGQATVDAGTASQFAALGLAFSTPSVVRVRIDADGDAGTSNDTTAYTALLFGGGYNGGRNSAGNKVGKDLNNSRATAPTSQVGQDDGSGTTDRGNAIFMVDAATGQLLWRAVRSTTASASFDAASKTYSQPMLVDSIPSDLTAVDTDNDGYTDRFYVGDTGGRVWRGDLAGALRSSWTLTPIASVGRHNNSSSTLAKDRRIFFAPDFVPVRSTLDRSGVDLVLFGTGDREDPLNLVTQNWFYVLKDTDTVSGKAASEIVTTETNSALPKHNDFDNFDTGTLRDVTGLTTGYRFSFPRTGEKYFSSPVTLGGTTTFTSYIPPDPSDPNAPICTPSEGVSRLYSIGVRKSEFRSINNASSAGRDLPLSTGLPGEINVLSGTNQAAGGQVFSIDAREKYRASWRERLGETQK